MMLAKWRSDVNSKSMLKHAFIDKINIFSMIVNIIEEHVFFDCQVLKRIVKVSFGGVDTSFSEVITDRTTERITRTYQRKKCDQP